MTPFEAKLLQDAVQDMSHTIERKRNFATTRNDQLNQMALQAALRRQAMQSSADVNRLRIDTADANADAERRRKILESGQKADEASAKADIEAMKIARQAERDRALSENAQVRQQIGQLNANLDDLTKMMQAGQITPEQYDAKLDEMAENISAPIQFVLQNTIETRRGAQRGAPLPKPEVSPKTPTITEEERIEGGVTNKTTKITRPFSPTTAAPIATQPTPQGDDRVTVSKDGKLFTLPKSQLSQALAVGYTLVK